MIRKLQYVFAALLLAATLGQAKALTLDIGDLIAGGSVTLGRLFSTGKSFTDVVNFTLSNPATVSVDWSSSGIAGVKLAAPDGISVTSAGGTLATDPLSVGAYSASLLGTATPGGTYEVTLSASALNASPAPEPGAWLMFAAGLAVLGVIAKKRTK